MITEIISGAISGIISGAVLSIILSEYDIKNTIYKNQLQEFNNLQSDFRAGVLKIVNYKTSSLCTNDIELLNEIYSVYRLAFLGTVAKYENIFIYLTNGSKIPNIGSALDINNDILKEKVNKDGYYKKISIGNDGDAVYYNSKVISFYVIDGKLKAVFEIDKMLKMINNTAFLDFKDWLKIYKKKQKNGKIITGIGVHGGFPKSYTVNSYKNII